MKKILVIEGLKQILQKEKNILSRKDFTISTAASGQEAVDMLREEHFDLLIADLNMPGMNGDELCALLRADEALKRVSVIIACHNNKPAVERCIKSGANAFITHPVDLEELSLKISGFFAISARKGMRVLMKVSVGGKFNNNSFFSFSENISTTGILLKTDKFLAKGDRIVCSFFLHSEPITADGEVVRIVKGEDGQYRYGARFIGLAPRAKTLIAEFVKSCQT